MAGLRVPRRGIFNGGSNFKDRYFDDYRELKKCVDHCRGLGLKIVLTQGSWDMLHIGHARYFEKAKAHGDLLLVGVDSDEKIKARKGPDRPVVPETERVEMLSHIRHVDMIVKKPLRAKKWALIEMVRPDVLIVISDNYKNKELKEVKKLCGKVLVLKPQATTSTSAKIRLVQIGAAKKFQKVLEPKIFQAIEEALTNAK